jgi:SAM-dependent methyltransferase
VWTPDLPSDGSWQPIEEDEERRLVERLCARFDFVGSIEASGWPAIREPTPSVTWDLEPVFADFVGRFHACDRRISAALIAQFGDVLRPGGRIAAVDIHHPCYWVDPRAMTDRSVGSWPFGVLPDGDYWCFVAPDLRCGTFGHPWERTLCVFGAELMPVAEEVTRILGEPYRRNGRPCRSQRGRRWSTSPAPGYVPHSAQG